MVFWRDFGENDSGGEDLKMEDHPVLFRAASATADFRPVCELDQTAWMCET